MQPAGRELAYAAADVEEEGEVDPRSGAFLGNFPQAFTHIGFINRAVYIAHAEGRPVPAPAPAPLGSPEELEAGLVTQGE